MHVCPRVEIQGGEGGGLILSFIAFLCDNFKIFPNFDLPQGGGVKSRTPLAKGVIPVLFFKNGKVWRISYLNFLVKQAEGKLPYGQNPKLFQVLLYLAFL